MAAITQPGPFGAHSGRRYGSFAGKASGAIDGPYRVDAVGVYVAGAAATNVWRAGSQDTENYQAGATKTQVAE